MSKKQNSTVKDLRPCLREFLATPEGGTVTGDELRALIAMQRTLHESFRAMGHDLEPSVSIWRAALAQARCLHPLSEGDGLCTVDVQPAMDGSARLARASNDIALRLFQASRMRSSQAARALLDDARSELAAASAVLSNMALVLGNIEAAHPSLVAVGSSSAPKCSQHPEAAHTGKVRLP